MSQAEMDVSDDGQIKSSGDDFIISGEEDENDLEIKPPQASRDFGGSARRKDKSHKEKKRTKEKRHKERTSLKERDREKRNSSGGGGGGGVAGGVSASNVNGVSGMGLGNISGGRLNDENDRHKEHREHHHRDRERRSNDHREHRERERNLNRDEQPAHYQGHRGAAGYDSERRYMKIYENSSGMTTTTTTTTVTTNHGYHHHQQQQHNYVAATQYHYQVQQKQRQDYYDHHSQRTQAYHSLDYANSRHNPHAHAHAHVHGHAHAHSHSHSHSHGHGHHPHHNDYDAAVLRDRRKHNYDQGKDPESLEQDLRSRLLSKRHKYTNDDAEDEEGEYVRMERGKRHSYGGEENNGRKSEKHKKSKKSRDVIEVLDSPEHLSAASASHQRRKHKHRRSRERVPGEVVEKRKTPDDPELLARRAKFLAAEREKEHRKELAREELEARREKHKEKNELADALSPSHVAARVTAGLHLIKRKKSLENEVEIIERKKSRKKHAKSRRRSSNAAKGRGDQDEQSEHASSASSQSDNNNEDDDDEEDGDENSSSNTESESFSESEKEKVKGSSKKRRKSKTSKSSANNTVHLVNDSPVSGENVDSSLTLKQSGRRRTRRKKSHKKLQHSKKSKESRRHRSPTAASNASDTETESSSSESRASRSGSVSSQSDGSGSHSASRSRSRSISHTYSRSRSAKSRSPLSHSRSRSRSRTSHSSSPTRSRTRSEERDMKSFQHKAEIERNSSHKKSFSEKTSREDAESRRRDESPDYDPAAEGLPNYFPGVQGCRSVEEFQCLNRIEEGTYGVVYRAKDKRTNEIVALKRLKMEKEKEGFPITSLREINTLLKGQHPNIVTVREIVVGSNMDKIFIVMDYVEHDLKSLMETMKNRKQSFFPGEIKCLTQQLLRAVRHLHDNWILHRDLKTSNLLLSHKGILKVGDFGLAREYGSPLKKYTSLVVTLWYRAPELLLCAPEYSTPIDVWSVGCIFGEFLQMAPLFPGKSEIDELNKIFKELGTPNEKIWPGYNDLPAVKNIISQNSQFAEYPVSNLRKHFSDKTTDLGIDLLQGLLTYDPKKRLTADAALKHPYFRELPLPIDPSMFPTWPAKSELGARKATASSPKPPSGGLQFKQLGRDDNIIGGSGAGGVNSGGIGGNNQTTNSSSNNNGTNNGSNAGGGNASASNTSSSNTSGSGKIVSGIITGHRKTVANTGFVLNSGVDQRQLNMGSGFSLKF